MVGTRLRGRSKPGTLLLIYTKELEILGVVCALEAAQMLNEAFSNKCISAAREWNSGRSVADPFQEGDT